MKKIRTFDTIEKECVYCNSKFIAMWNNRNQQFCSKKCMYEWRKSLNWETAICKHCKNTFKRRKKDRSRSNKKRMFCSNECNRASDYRKRKLRKWIKLNNPMNNKESIEKIAITKFKKYANAKYNNPDKSKNTLIERYGVTIAFNTHKSNGHSISKPQKTVYKYVKSLYKTSKLECVLKDVQMSVDIYIQKINTVIEVNGDYWHMNPTKYNPQDYNSNAHLTAEEIWKRDEIRLNKLKNAGYNVISLWECDVKSGKYKDIIK